MLLTNRRSWPSAVLNEVRVAPKRLQEKEAEISSLRGRQRKLKPGQTH